MAFFQEKGLPSIRVSSQPALLRHRLAPDLATHLADLGVAALDDDLVLQADWRQWWVQGAA